MNSFKTILLVFFVFTGINTFAQDSTWVWQLKGVKSLKVFTSIAYHEGIGEQGLGIPVGIGYQVQYFRGRVRLNFSLQAASFRNFGITDVPDNYYRVTTLGAYANFDILRYYSISIFLSAGTALSYSRGMISSWFDEDSGIRISGKNFNRWYPTLYGGYGIRISPRKAKYAVEILFPPGGHASRSAYLIHALRVGVDFRL